MRISAFGQQAGPDPARMELRANGKAIKVFDVKAVERAPEVYELRGNSKAGERRISAAYINNYVNPNDPNPDNRDRNLIIEYIEIVGPLGGEAPDLPETHKRIFTQLSEPGHEIDAARAIIGSFAKRAFRRPVTTEEVDRLIKFFELAQKNGDSFEKSVKLALQAVLVSPHFLFRELPLSADVPKKAYEVDEFTLASRLSYFLWSSMPDEELFALAERGELRKNLDAQVKRMLKDARSRALVDNFAGQWLQLRNLAIMAPDAKLFPGFDDALRAAMQKETEMFFETVMREDRSILDFLNGDWTFVNERLAQHYGMRGVKGDEFRRVSLKGTHRGGVLTQGSVLTLTSNPTRTSPVKRGKWVLENLLGTPPPPPPPDVPNLDDTGRELTGTLRQRMEQHRTNPVCAGCHARMDPIGFGLENFDGIGAWRTKDDKSPVDAAGELVSGEKFKDAVGLEAILLKNKRDEFVQCLSEKVLTYALGRGMEYYDKATLKPITQGVAKNNYKFSSLIMEVVKSVPFQMRRGEAERAAEAGP